MAVITELLPDQFLTVSEFRALTEFPAVSARSDARLGFYLARAQILLWEWLPFNDQSKPHDFATQMKVAVFMIAESLALANPSRAAAAAGFSSETIGKYSYSRAPGGGSTGEGLKGDLVPDEALYILLRWSTTDDDTYGLSTTNVFTQAAATADNEMLRVYALGDDLHLTGWPGAADSWGSGPRPRG